MVTGLVWVVSGFFAGVDFFSVGFLRGPFLSAFLIRVLFF